MKNNKFLSVLLAVIAVMTSCQKDDFENSIPDGHELVVEINGDNASTRVSYSEWATSFDTNDQIGVYCWNGSSVVAANIPYTKQSDGTWTTATATRIPYNASYTYFCYFPYRSDHNYTPGTSGDADTRFASFITDTNNMFWNANQSTKVNYDASNLMVGAGSHVGSGNKVRFAMGHKRGLAVFEGEGLDDATFSGNVPYDITSTRKVFLLKPNASTTIGDYSLSAAAGKYVSQNIPVDYLKKYLTLTAETAGTFSFKIPSVVTPSILSSVSYSLDNGSTWVTTSNTNDEITITTPSVSAGDKVLWKGIGRATSKASMSSSNASTFGSTCKFSVSGNIMSMIYGDNFRGRTTLPSTYTFQALFLDNINYKYYLTSAENLKLPATTMTEGCYFLLFQKCQNMTKAPQLPATTLAKWCYAQMFQDCNKLIESPKLPAKTLAQGCYMVMFSNCKALKKIEMLATDISAGSCLNNWVNGVASSGTFIKATSMTSLPSGANGIPSGWTVQNAP